MTMVARATSVSVPDASPAATPQRARRRFGVVGISYSFVLAATIVGWLVTRELTLVDPLQGAGYWLGIIGASLMVALLLYPVRKRIRALRRLGATRHWFRMHMTFGVLGPLLILYHCNFQFGSLNSNVALISTLIVAASGLVGRYLHAKVYADLDGHRRNLQEMSARAGIGAVESSHTAKLVPKLVERMSRIDEQVLLPPQGFMASIALPMKLAVTTRLAHISLLWHGRREVRDAAKRRGLGSAQLRTLKWAVRKIVATHLRQVRTVAEFNSYERLFSLWHVFHLPFFFILVMTAVIHVLAVHMY